MVKSGVRTLYNILFTIGFVLSSPYYFARMRRRGNWQQGFAERFGRYNTKLKQAITFLEKRDKVKVNLFFRGRQMEHLDLGRKILDRFINEAQNHGQVEKEPSLDGRVMSFVIAPK